MHKLFGFMPNSEAVNDVFKPTQSFKTDLYFELNDLS